MPPTEFFAFDLLVSRPWTGGRSYRAHLVRSPAGEAKERLRWPRRAELEKLLTALGQPGGAALGAVLLGSRAASRVVRDVVEARERKGPLNPETAAALGEILFQFLFPGRIQKRLSESLVVAQRHRVGLALRLHLSAVPELAALPWEYLYNPDKKQFLVQAAHVEVARTLDHDPSLIQPPAAKLTILVVAANPFNDLSLDREVSDLKEMERRSAGRIEVEILKQPTLLEVQQQLQGDRQFDVVHFAGHGSFRESDRGGELALAGEGGGHEWISANTLAANLKDHTSLRLVVLNTCKSGQQAPSAPLPGVAEALILHEIRSAVAMQARISDNAAIAFSRGFYEGYAETRSIAHAMASGRAACGPEWAIPRLFTREGAMIPPSFPFLAVSLALVPFVLCASLCTWSHTHCQTLAISYPTSYAEVGPVETISGKTTCPLPPGQDAWIIIYSPTQGLYFPNAFKANIDADGDWASRATMIGGTQDGGKPFEIIAALADAQGGQSLAAGTAGVPALPDGVKIYQRINVIRK
jgi:CHAT domain